MAEHYRLIELAAAGNVKLIRALLKEHIRTWEPIFVEAIQRSGRQPLRRRPEMWGSRMCHHLARRCGDFHHRPAVSLNAARPSDF